MPLSFFVRHCATFFRNFFNDPKAPLRVFRYICTELKFQKPQRVFPSKFFGTVRLFKILIFSFISKIFNVFKGSPFNVFDILQQTGFLKSPKGPPSTILKLCAV